MPRKITSGIVGGPVLGNLSSDTNIFSSREANTNIIFTPDGTGVTQFTKDILTSSNAGVRFGDGDTNYALIKAPNALASNYTLTLPADDGTASNVLQTDGSGNLSWAVSGLTVTERSAADNTTYYVTMSDQTSGAETTLSISSDRMSFVPNPGRLSVAELRSTASTASNSTSTGSLVVTGGVGVGGQVTAVSIVETSSITLKENVTPIENALDKILKLKGVTYNRLDNNEHESGLIAEWTEEVLPELVTRDTNNDVVGIKYTKLTAYLIEAIKSLNTEIKHLKSR
jgi:hypothetical protein|tara:strand:- start:1066 stop:1920 length:855 start_codon:yes stop_codon:yes gene_type:complete